MDAKHQLSFRCNEVEQVGSSLFFFFSSVPSLLFVLVPPVSFIPPPLLFTTLHVIFCLECVWKNPCVYLVKVTSKMVYAKIKKKSRSEDEQAVGARGRKTEGERSRKPWSLVSPLRARAGGSEHAG